LALRLTDVVKQGLLKKPVWILRNLVSLTIFHELTHAVSKIPGTSRLEILDLPDSQSAYGWKNVINKKAPIAVKNAENYGYFGLWAVLADLGYSLPRVDEKGLTKEEKEDQEYNAKVGFMVPRTKKRMRN
jgi:hypothetical protein